jgi:putative glutamine amidotransferase
MTPLRPLIGVTTSEMREAARTHPLPDGDAPQREMALGIVYLRAIERAGGLPVVLPPLHVDAIPDLLDQLAGICLSGGPDLEPGTYAAHPDPHLGETEPELDAFELALVRAADERNLPLLGICRGAQTLNVAYGGTLHQHVADVVGTTIEHRQAAPGQVKTHDIDVAPNSLLRRLLATEHTAVNSFHHQAVDRLGRGLRAVAWSDDGLIEAIETDGPTLTLGVQWHAEGLVDDPAQLRLFEALVTAAGQRRRLDEDDRAAA